MGLRGRGGSANDFDDGDVVLLTEGAGGFSDRTDDGAREVRSIWGAHPNRLPQKTEAESE